MAGRKGRHTKRKQRGGGDGQYGYTGPAFTAAAGVPIESRGASYTQCGWDVRPAAPDVTAFKTTQFGGRRQRSRSRRVAQRGGGCGCMAAPPMQAQRGGGGGTGGFGFALDNSLGKVYSSLNVGACPPAPRESQIGGAAVDDLGIVSYKSGYGFGPASVYSTASAHYLDKLPYDRTVLTGGKRKGSRKGRKGRKGSRKH